MYYTYYIRWTKQNVHYYGVRATSVIPDEDFWIKYFTSSKYVKQHRKEFGDPDVVEIRKIFVNRDEAIAWERRVLIKIGAKKSPHWLNRYDGSYVGAVGPKNHGHKISLASK